MVHARLRTNNYVTRGQLRVSVFLRVPTTTLHYCNSTPKFIHENPRVASENVRMIPEPCDWKHGRTEGWSQTNAVYKDTILLLEIFRNYIVLNSFITITTYFYDNAYQHLIRIQTSTKNIFLHVTKTTYNIFLRVTSVNC